MAWFIVLIPPETFKPTIFSFFKLFIVFNIISADLGVALILTFPVEVLIKFMLFLAKKEDVLLISFSLLNSPVSIIAFK